MTFPEVDFADLGLENNTMPTAVRAMLRTENLNEIAREILQDAYILLKLEDEFYTCCAISKAFREYTGMLLQTEGTDIEKMDAFVKSRVVHHVGSRITEAIARALRPAVYVTDTKEFKALIGKKGKDYRLEWLQHMIEQVKQ